ncbi:MAG: hypothetical protein HY677_05305 [Chloroflexi bacterium]|nr:hypothetical protein [Chloroflexota bacterium]
MSQPKFEWPQDGPNFQGQIEEGLDLALNRHRSGHQLRNELMGKLTIKVQWGEGTPHIDMASYPRVVLTLDPTNYDAAALNNQFVLLLNRLAVSLGRTV